MRRLPAILTAALLLALPALGPAPAAGAEAGPAWLLSITPQPANFTPGATGEFLIFATNVGAGATTAPTTIEATLSEALTPLTVSGANSTPGSSPASCEIQSPSNSLRCEEAGTIGAGQTLLVTVKAQIAASPGGPAAASASVSGGGAASREATSTVPLQSAPVPFGFLEPGLLAPLTGPDGSAAALAASHPYQQTVEFTFPTQAGGGGGANGSLTNAGHPRDIVVDLPQGFLGDPAATAVRCTEVELASAAGCPPESQVGVFDLTSIAGEVGHSGIFQTPIFNMVPPPGAPAELATDVAHLGLLAHLVASVRSEGDYGIQITTPDVLALGSQPIFGINAQVWGDPSQAAHDAQRGHCLVVGGACEAERQKSAFLTMPGSCPPAPTQTAVAADSWEAPGAFAHATYSAADLAGAPVGLAGCNALEYSPTIEVHPSTNLADSPSGLEVELRQPSEEPHKEPLSGRAPAELRNASVTLPAGMAVNPSQADGLAACSEAQIGYLEEGHYSAAPNSCPEASKLGGLEVESPLLAQYKDEGTKAVRDPETGAVIPRALGGSVYLAKPFDNPFGSLLAIYLAVEDPQSGIVAKLAGRIEPDPQSGRLRTVFEENPELPLSAIRLHLFGGPRGALITPPVCGAHTTTTTLTPWSSPEGQDAHPESSFQTTAEPGGGACPTSEAAALNAPAFSAGTISPQAGAYSPFILKLSREDGSQRLTGIDTTLPPGLSGKLAGIAQCSEAQIAEATARSHPGEGILERESPSCPATSKVGVVNVGAGAGPTPFYTQGAAYLAGPYKGAPLSLVIVTPAIAGPFDLGAVVLRTALYVDLTTAQIHAVSDPFPTILDGIPLDLRSVALAMDRPDFTLNPTSCDEMQITGNATSALGSLAPLSRRFQVGGCSALAFKPKLKLSLNGPTKRSGNPALRAVLTMAPGGANIARAQVGFPLSEFIDQGNLDKVCVQADLKAGTCPAGSIYGHAKAWSPLLDKPLEGPVYLGVGYGHRLPDVVADLNGQIRVLLHGKVDTTPKGGIRNTFEVVPDAPVSRFELQLKGGEKYGLLENHENLCAHTQRASARFTAQNGKVAQLQPKIGNDCGPGKGKRGR